ncbi:S-adenosyl-L-methionine-dependent methyltransferase [Neolentinus lepideus HHB14362 ss-1]|uniref:S-adenosyl-L-methionine-dependent methyltransferase n=1 Tax=Neolentinus lepideus HHB14362 ss-1 TaxID=1314782 RepID=A0A165RIE4_9AGAM|nr:S-adenosyl-L-methionine-dependent methyltransferase [Neolentinus lepideus HHB14362 ss-1]
MIPTPDLSHLTRQDYEHVYEPAEDTFILLDALEQDVEYLKSLRPRICLEIGSGSGCASSFLGALLGCTSSLYLCTDINPHATKCTVSTGKQNKIELDVVLTSFAHPLHSRLRKSVDVLLFNPPYVPTIDEEAAEAQNSADIQGAWAGGKNGMQVTNQLLGMVESLLSSNGCFYLVAVKQNDILSIRKKMLEGYGLKSEVVIQRRAGGEHLFVVKFSHGPPVQ